jgi:outer membrane lipoprotein-sorting protein
MKSLFKLAIVAAIAAALPAWAQAADKLSATPISAQEILEENSAARGGTAAWHAIDSFTLAGKISTGDTQTQQFNFLLNVKRPGKARIELQLQGQRAFQVFDGQTAWKLAPFLQKYNEQPDGPRAAVVGGEGLDLGGPLLDYEGKGVLGELEGTENVDGHDAYRLKLTMKDGGVRHMWVDTKSFLEVKVDSNPRVINGRIHAVTTRYSDYRPVQGLMIPHVIETVVEGLSKPEKVTIDAVEVNPKLDDNLFEIE